MRTVHLIRAFIGLDKFFVQSNSILVFINEFMYSIPKRSYYISVNSNMNLSHVMQKHKVPEVMSHFIVNNEHTIGI